MMSLTASQTVSVVLAHHRYDIQIGSGVLEPARAQALLKGRRALLLTDDNVALAALPRALTAFGLDPSSVHTIAAGEPSKTWSNAEQVLDHLLRARLGRDTVLIALGGGVVGDLGGFCAAIFQRGIAFIQVPTTLLAMVDSSVGGKTGINHPVGKNLIGAFHQPEAVLADLDLLTTLPARERSAGIAEIIKYGLLGDADFFSELERAGIAGLLAGDAAMTAHIVAHCCAMKARIVGLDEREALRGGPRALLNLGHTFGHAVEAHTGYSSWLHGEAVALGLLMAADLSARLGAVPWADVERVRALLQRAALPVVPPPGMTPADFRRHMAGDKKTLAGQLRLVLLRRMGEAYLTADFDEEQLGATLAAFCA